MASSQLEPRTEQAHSCSEHNQVCGGIVSYILCKFSLPIHDSAENENHLLPQLVPGLSPIHG